MQQHLLTNAIQGSMASSSAGSSDELGHRRRESSSSQSSATSSSSNSHRYYGTRAAPTSSRILGHNMVKNNIHHQQTTHSYSSLYRPVSLGNLLLEPTASTSASVSASVPAGPAPGFAGYSTMAGDLPRSSSPNVAPLLSPAGSIQSFMTTTSIASTSAVSSLSSATAIQARASKVILPTNEHGVRTRVNILPPNRISANQGDLQSGNSTGAPNRPLSSASTILLASKAGDTGKDDETGPLASFGQRTNISLLGTYNAPTAYNRAHQTTRSVSDMLTSRSIDALASSGDRQMPARSRSPMPLTSHSQSQYMFPARPTLNSSVSTSAVPTTTQYNVHPGFDATAPAPDTPLGRGNHATSYSLSSYESSSAHRSPSILESAGQSSVYTTPSTSKPSPSTSSSAASPYTTMRPGIPRSLMPGGIDYSPTPSNGTQHTSTSTRETYETARSQSPIPFITYQATSNGTSSPGVPKFANTDPYANSGQYAFARDRSASVPRTVSDIQSDGESSGRPSLGDEEFRSASRLNGRKSPAFASMAISDSRQPSRSQSRQQLRDEEHILPQISPVPPKLDMDFGGGFGLDLDFGGSFMAGLGETPKKPKATQPPSDRKPSVPGLGLGSFLSSFPEASVSITQPSKSVPVKQESRPASSLPDFSLGWGFPPASRLPEPPSERQSKSNEDSHPAKFIPPQRSTVAPLQLPKFPRSDSDTTPKASLSPLQLNGDAKPNVPEPSRSSIQHGTLSDVLGFLVSNSQTQMPERSDTPSSIGSGSFHFSRPSSSLLAYVPSSSDAKARQGGHSGESESKRTTLSSGENTSKTGFTQASRAAQAGSDPNSARLSFNKSLPALPPVNEKAVDKPSGANSTTSLQRPVPNRTRSDSAASVLSYASSADARMVPHTRSRSSTLERQLPPAPSANHLTSSRVPHGSSASHTTKLELADTGAVDTAVVRGPLRPQATRMKTHPGGELIKKDAATEQLLAAVSEKLEKWLERHQSRLFMGSEGHGSETTAAGGDESFGVTTDAASSDSDEQSANVSTDDVALSVLAAAKVVSASQATSASALRLSKAELIAKHPKHPKHPSIDDTSASKKQTTGYHAPSSSFTEESLVSKLSSSLVKPQGPEESKAAKDSMDRKSTMSMKLEPVQPLRINPKQANATRPASTHVSQIPQPKRSAREKRFNGELAWTQAWLDIETSLKDFRAALDEGRQDRASIIQTSFQPSFKQEELGSLVKGGRLSKRQRELLFQWVDVMFEDLAGTPANRGACLDGIAAVIESRLMSYFSYGDDQSDQKRFKALIATLLNWAIDKLNGKAIFANTLGFAGKMLAAAFWNLDGVALKLLRLLPAVKKQHMQRILTEAGVEDCPGRFPPLLERLCYAEPLVAYYKQFTPVRPGVEGDRYLYFREATKSEKTNLPSASEQPGDSIAIEMGGNWLIRWTATDSDLPFAFMRAYHRQLSNFLPVVEEGASPLQTAQLVRAPGYLFIVSTLLEVCDALIHRNLRSVTTMAPSNSGVNADESANLAAGQKPKALEVVSKRVIQTIFEVVGGPIYAASVTKSAPAFASAAMRHNFGCSLQTWIAAVTKRTSMWDTRGIFALLDLIEGLLFNVCAPAIQENDDGDEEEEWHPNEIGLRLFDTKFILSFIKTILTKADNTTCLLRTISFLYTEFESFTLRPSDREELCDNILLHPDVFNRLFLYYNVGVRGYFLRLLVYRLSRLGNPNDNGVVVRDPRVYATLRKFEARLEKIRQRHDEIDPLDDWSDSEDEFYTARAKRSTICSTWGVHDAPWTMSNRPRRPSSEFSEDDRQKVEEQNATVEAIEEMPPLPEPSPPILSTPSANSSTSSLTASKPKKGVAAAKKVAGGLWTAMKNTRKASNDKKKQALADEVAQPPYASMTGGSALGLAPMTSTQQQSPPKKLPGIMPDQGRAHTKKPDPLPPRPSEAESVDKDVMDIESPVDSPSLDFLKVDIYSPRSRKVSSSRKSIRRAPSNAASPRSRRSSMYSFDLDFDVPRSDAFDFPMSPSSATSPTSPSNSSGTAAIPPLSFSGVADGTLDQGNAILSNHKRAKSNGSMVRRSRPVSTISEKGGPSPRVSKRFSKRASILPPPALDLLRESPSEPVPKIPEQFKTPTSGTNAGGLFGGDCIPERERAPSPEPYDRKLHPYAVRGLREYEDCLDEWELFVIRAKEEEGVDGKELSSLIPRLQCAWPSTWEE